MIALVDAPATQAIAGRICPLSYRYSPAVFNRAPELRAATLYVVGGLYGNPEALDAVEALFADEPGIAGTDKLMVFNGDFHWFDIDPALFAALDQRVHMHVALRGNVETEICHDDEDAGCGCAYPNDVDQAIVARSNQIIRQLRATVQPHLRMRARLARLPMHAVAQVGDARVAIVHGDAESLAGWRFDAAALDDPAQQAWRDAAFDTAKVDIFASSHTCAPAMRVFGGGRAVINNGAAGMASMPQSTCGIVTRIGVSGAPPGFPVLASRRVTGVHVQALALQFDGAAWQQRFLAMWPQGSAAHQSYWQRIAHGPRQNTLHAAVDHHSCAQ